MSNFLFLYLKMYYNKRVKRATDMLEQSQSPEETISSQLNINRASEYNSLKNELSASTDFTKAKEYYKTAKSILDQKKSF